MRRQLPMILVFVGGVFMVFQFFVPHESSEWVYEYLLDWIVIIGIFALALGIWSLVHVSIERIRRRHPNWGYSYVTLFGLLAMIVFGWTGKGENGRYQPYVLEVSAAGDTTVVAEGEPLPPDSLRRLYGDPLFTPKQYTAGNVYEHAGRLYRFVPDSSWGVYFYTQEGLDNPAFRRFFDYILIPIQATMFSLLAFFIASAAYRAFRARNVLSTILLLAALIVMLRFMPGPWGNTIAESAAWIMNVPNMAAQRAIVIGIGLGIVATALKVVLGIERGYMGKG